MEIFGTKDEASLTEAMTIGDPNCSPERVSRFYGFTARNPLPRTVHPEAELVYSAAMRFGLLTESEVCEARRAFEFHTYNAANEDRLGILAHALIACERAFWFDTERERPPDYAELFREFAGLSDGQFCPTHMYQHTSQTIDESGFGKDVVFQFLHGGLLFRTTFADNGDWTDTWKLIQTTNSTLATQVRENRFIRLRHDGQSVCVTFVSPAVHDQVLEEIEASIEPQLEAESVLVDSLPPIDEYFEKLQANLCLEYFRGWFIELGSKCTWPEVAKWRNDEGDTALHCIAGALLPPEFLRELVRLLVLNGSDINAINENGRKPIDKIERVSDARLLMEYGADLAEQRLDIEGCTLLHRISNEAVDDEEGLELLEFLLNFGVDVNAQTKQLNSADEIESNKRFCFALGIVYDPSVEKTGGLTPLHFAAKQGAVEVIKLLLQHGADPYITNDRSETAMDVAASAGHHQITQLLKEAKQSRL